MKQKVQGIVLRPPVRHSDRADILTVYSSEYGRLSVVVPAGGGRTVRQRKAAFMPLSLIEFNLPASNPTEGTLKRASDFSLLVAYRTLYFDPVKSSLAMFLSEFLNRLLRDSSPDPLMYRYLRDSIQLLDEMSERRLANYHIAFLTGISTFAGIAPDVSDYTSASLFDMISGRYTTMPPAHRHTLTGVQARIPLMLARMNYANQHLFRFTRQQRKEILEGILRYFGLHFPGTDSNNSLDILTSLFS